MNDTPCAQIQAIAPWYVNGTASAVDRARVDAHLAGCSDCRQRVVAEQRVAAHMRDGHSVDTPDAELAWERFERTIGPEAAQPAQDSRHWRWIVAAQAAALVIFAVAFWQLQTDQRRAAASYRTVTTAAPLAARDHVLLHMAVQPDVSADRVAELAREQGGTVVGRPSSQGVYTLELLPDALHQQAIARLRATQGVLLVEPIANSATR
jgi:predicted anti-sigma-YlaC factor YlaD